MTHTRNHSETIDLVRVKKLMKTQACKSHLEAEDKANRPSEATIDEVRTATVTAIDQLAAADDEINAVGQVYCPCLVLGAAECTRES